MKRNLLFLTLATVVSSFLFTGCAKEGCTDPDSVNYNVDAKKDDGTCTYEGSVVFWYGESISTFLIDDEAISLTYYVNGEIVGSSAASVYFTGAPDCDQSGSVGYTMDLGTSTSKSVTYKIVDQTDYVYWEGTVNLEANSCQALELTN